MQRVVLAGERTKVLVLEAGSVEKEGRAACAFRGTSVPRP